MNGKSTLLMSFEVMILSTDTISDKMRSLQNIMYKNDARNYYEEKNQLSQE